MRAFICDWCGDAYKPEPILVYGGSLAAQLKFKQDNKQIEAPIGSEAIHMSWKTEYSDSIAEHSGKVYDICPSCAEALRDFIKGRQKGEHK